MDIIRSSSIEGALENTKRIYLCGDLKRENGVSHIFTDGYEIGISDYKEYTFESAHFHAFNREYNYVLAGSVKIFMIDEKKEYEFSAGDLFVINTNEPYASKELPGTRTMFSKVPGGDDKKLVDMCESLIEWGSSWSSVYEEHKK